MAFPKELCHKNCRWRYSSGRSIRRPRRCRSALEPRYRSQTRRIVAHRLWIDEIGIRLLRLKPLRPAEVYEKEVVAEVALQNEGKTARERACRAILRLYDHPPVGAEVAPGAAEGISATQTALRFSREELWCSSCRPPASDMS